ncbi:ATP/GTP-binding protein [Arthrobacter sp.]|uniref:ATP/GTP-binding protein n=1 Tax=Arthrobacter sp. TaxID=1667 RepID=UPI0026E08271|nr:ATP/GTP-binding protein [Arthrobacter sp.]MDO5751894.1 ATP/GTP-binding protein [Arthrobacter sp.]
MPRSNRPRRSHGSAARNSKWTRGTAQNEDDDLNRTRLGIPTTEAAPDGVWAVRSISAGNAQKVYTCPGCNHQVMPGVAHLVVWQEDALFGAEAGVRERRHWHSNCWQGRRYRYK